MAVQMHHLPYGPESQLPNFLKFDRKARCADVQMYRPLIPFVVCPGCIVAALYHPPG